MKGRNIFIDQSSVPGCKQTAGSIGSPPKRTIWLLIRLHPTENTVLYITRRGFLHNQHLPSSHLRPLSHKCKKWCFSFSNTGVCRYCQRQNISHFRQVPNNILFLLQIFTMYFNTNTQYRYVALLIQSIILVYFLR